MAKRAIRLSIAVASAICLMFAVPAAVSAHSLAKDGRISAFLHIPPNDKPAVGKVNQVHIYYNDQDFRFTTEGCICKITVTEGQITLYNGDLQAVGTRVGQLNVLLPDNNVSYGVVVAGTPKTAGFFQPFKLNFDIDAGNPPLVTTPKPKHQLIIPAAGIAILASGLSYYPRHIKKTKLKRQGGTHE